MQISQLANIELPIIQAPMAGAQGSALTLAVSQVGALGSLPAAMLDARTLRAELQTIRSQTDKPFNVNFFCHPAIPLDLAQEERWRQRLRPYYTAFELVEPALPSGPARMPFNAEMADILEVFAPPVVSFHFGLPEPALLQRVKAWGARILSSATTVDEGLWLQAHGADAVIAQGLPAGGHRGHFLAPDLQGQCDTLPLVRQLVAQLRVPVIAAGGIADTAGVQAALQAGAIAVQIGTAYLLCPQANTSALHRQALRQAAKQPGAAHTPTQLTNLFTGRPARGLPNRVMRELGPICPDAPVFPWASTAIAPLRQHAESQGSADFSPLWSGTNTSGCTEMDAGKLTRQLAGR
jgi:nitronate monooxygenase